MYQKLKQKLNLNSLILSIILLSFYCFYLFDNLDSPDIPPIKCEPVTIIKPAPECKPVIEECPACEPIIKTVSLEVPSAESAYFKTREQNFEDLLATITSLPENVIIREKFFATNQTFQEKFRKLKHSNDVVNKALKDSILDQVFLGQLDPKSEDFNFSIDRKSEEIVRKRRLPNLLGIGVKKCGTGAIREFLNHHPKFLKSIPWINEKTGKPNPEPHYYDDNYDNGLDWFFELFPASAPSDILFEKSPKYIATSNVPKRIYDTYRKFGKDEEKNVKIIAMFCDPSTRVFSDFLQSFTTKDWTAEEKKYIQDEFIGEGISRWKEMVNLDKTELRPEVAEGFVKYVQLGIEFLNNMEANLSYSNDNSDDNTDESFRDFVTKMNDHKLDQQFNYTGNNYQDILNFKYIWQPITKGLYSYQIQNWLKYFNRDQFILIDGTGFKTVFLWSNLFMWICQWFQNGGSAYTVNSQTSKIESPAELE